MHVRGMLFRDNQGVALVSRIDVHECERVIVFIKAVTGNFAGNDFAK
jgi:hypothetical protein